MKNSILEIEENRQIAPGVYRAVLRGEGAGLHRPGQFINIALDGFYLRRPISVYDADPESEYLSAMRRSTVTSMARVISPSGSIVFFDTPRIRPAFSIRSR